MDKHNQKAEIMTLISEELDAWLDQSARITDGYEYETAFIEFSRKLSTILLEKSIGDPGIDRNKKTPYPYIDHYKRKVIIGDGARWIWRWAEDFHSDALQILDFFHAVEKLGIYAVAEFADDKLRGKWLDQQKLRLKNNQVKDIIEELQAHKAGNTKAAGLLKEVVGYYQSNSSRMDYKTYLEQGYLIGSGAIESAHRNVIQQRLK